MFPRLKDFGGLHYVQSENNGTIDFGFPPESMPFFPQIEGMPSLLVKLTFSEPRLVFVHAWNRYIHQYERHYYCGCTVITVCFWISIQAGTSPYSETTSWRT